MHLDPATKEIQDLLWEQLKLTRGPSVMTMSMKQSNLHAPAPNVASKSNKTTSSDLHRALYTMLIITCTSRIAFIAKPLTSDSRQSRAHHSHQPNLHSTKLRQVSCNLHVFLTDIIRVQPTETICSRQSCPAEGVAFSYEGRQLQTSVCVSGLSEQNQIAVCRFSGPESNTTGTRPSYPLSLATCWDDSSVDQSQPVTTSHVSTTPHPRLTHSASSCAALPIHSPFSRLSSNVKNPCNNNEYDHSSSSLSLCAYDLTCPEFQSVWTFTHSMLRRKFQII